MENWLAQARAFLLSPGFLLVLKNVIYAILIFVVGKWVAKLIKNSVQKIMRRHNVDDTLIGFLTHLIYFILLIFVVLAALERLGIKTTSLTAILAAAGFAVGLALQGGLANFAAGVLMLIFRPFRVGDYIEAAGTAGIVEAIHIFTTQLCTPDNKTIIIPNASITAGNIINYSAKPVRRVDLTFGCGYNDDLVKVKRVLDDILANDNRILAEPAPQVAISDLANSSVKFVVRPWVNSADYWDVYFDVTEKVKRRFDEEGIAIPFPQQDVHVYQHDAEK
ncbi:mechanosensitive ion channel [candidate division KSB1 bacterium]|nr:mechanosensitive ion channel [candidate division KSB1 bacterium]RQW04964.1 MAG: mechanosensitive ion channel family protein [candidate division KSB1 bacterium]